MKLLIYLLLLLTMPLAAQGKTDEKTLLDRIDKMIENDQYYQGIKEKELKHLKRQAYEAEDDQTRLLFLDSIYHAYSAYRYDSAYAYMKQGFELAKKCHNTYYILRNQINQASILSVRGFYDKAENLLQSLNPDEMPYQLKLYYYFTYAWLYSYWESYAKNSDYAEEFRAQKKQYMTLLVQSFNENNKHNVFYQYLMGRIRLSPQPYQQGIAQPLSEGIEDVASQIPYPCHVSLWYSQILQKKRQIRPLRGISRRGIRERWIVPTQRNCCASKASLLPL